MTAILGGVGAALAFATATLCSSRSSRLIGPGPALAWVMLAGFVAIAPFLAFGEAPDGVDGTTLPWLALVGGGNVGGLLLTYEALRRGKVAIVAPIVSTEGAIAAVLATVAGEALSAGVVLTLTVITVGVVLSATARDAPDEAAPVRDPRATALLAIGAAALFGAGLYATGRISGEVPVAWILLPARLIGIAVIATALLLTGRLILTRAAVPFVVLGGLCEVAGAASFTLGARDSIAVTAVLASLFAALAALGGFALFGERLARVQIVGVAAIVSGVAVLSAIQA